MLIEGQAKGIMPDVDFSIVETAALALAEGRPVPEMPVEGAKTEPKVAAQPPPLTMDETLLEIFSSEVKGHLQTLQNSLAECRDTSECHVSEEMVRAVHTLRGSSHLAEVDSMAELAGAMENYCNLEKIHTNVEDLDSFTEVLLEFHDTMYSILQVINVAGAELPVWQPVVERIQQNIAALEAYDLQVKEAAEIEKASQEQVKEQVIPLPKDVDLELLDIFLEEAGELVEKLDKSYTDWEEAARGSAAIEEIKRGLHTLKGGARLADLADVGDFVHILESLFEGISENSQLVQGELKQVIRDAIDQLHLSIETLHQQHGLIDLSLPLDRMEQFLTESPEEIEESALQDDSIITTDYAGGSESLLHSTDWVPDSSTVYEESVDGTSEAPVAKKLDVDAELLEIFLEEAAEMAEKLEGAFAAWTDDQSNKKPLAGLLRNLHTLKGGARLANLSAMADLAHYLESLFEVVVEDGVKKSAEIPVLVRHALDGIQLGLEQLQTTRSLPDLGGLTKALGAAAKGKKWRKHLTPQAETQPTESIISSDWVEHSDFTLDKDESTFIEDSSLFIDSDMLSETISQPTSEPLTKEGKVIPFPGTEKADVFNRPDSRPPPLQAEESSAGSSERVRVRSELLDLLVNNAGEVGIFRARMEQQNVTVGRNLEELSQTIGRLQRQVRSMEFETEAQILSRHEHELGEDGNQDFDPLEMDRYSTLQQLSRGLSETINDLSNIGGTLQEQARDTDTLLLQQARITNDLQDGLLRTRMVPFRRQASRLERVVRQTANSMRKKAELLVQGADGEIDRTILNSIMGPLEHLLRNAVAHGIETPAERRNAEKPPLGKVSLILARDGSDIVITISDDGKGLDAEAIKASAIKDGLLDVDANIKDEEIYQFILRSGVSTATEVSQISGRGVGMDVAVNEVKKLGGTLEIDSQPGRGSSFVIRLPFTLAITEALLVKVGEQTMAIPYGAVEVIVRATRQDLMECYNGVSEGIEYANHEYKLRYMGSMLGVSFPQLSEGQKWLPVLLVRSGERRVAIQVDRLLGNYEIVVKSIGSQLGNVSWFTGGTILADGSVAMILDLNALVRLDSSHQVAIPVEEEEQVSAISVMVVDDSITVRKVTSRLLERHNMEVVTAKDGVDAVTLLQDRIPDLMLLDIEMPRMDGYELARHIRHTPELSRIPIIMITSRTGKKHRQRALDLGVKRYLGKPFQEADLLENIQSLLAETQGRIN